MGLVTLNNITVNFLRVEGFDTDSDGTADSFDFYFEVLNESDTSVTIEDLVLGHSGGLQVYKRDDARYDPNLFTFEPNVGGLPVSISIHYNGFAESDLLNNALDATLRFTEYLANDFFGTFDEYIAPQPQNTGYKAWTELEEYYLDDGTPTGNSKLNDSADPDYVAPVYDTATCPLP